MGVSVLPNTQRQLSREPLRPDRPLPWQDCYHTSFDEVNIRIPTLFADASQANHLSYDEILQHIKVTSEDNKRRKQLKAEYEAEYPLPKAVAEAGTSKPQCNQPTGPSVNVSRTPETDDLSLALALNWVFGSRLNSIGTVGDSQQSDEEEYEENKFLAPTLAVMSYNLDVTNKIGNPEDLYEEIRLIK